VSLSATSRPPQTAPGPGSPYGVVVRLELPDAGGRSNGHRQEPPEPALDPHRLARAVEDLIRAIDPSLASARVQIEVTQDPVPTARLTTPLPTRTAEPAVETSPDRESGRSPGPQPPLDLGLDRAGRTLFVDGRAVLLTRREFDLLAYLQDHRGVALSRRELMTAVWQTDYLIGDRTIDVHIRRLRVKLGPQADRLSTLRGYGYRLD
jgi:transcriptional regulator